MSVKLKIHTEHPLATGKDTTEPKGTKNDNTDNESYINALLKKKSEIRYCDLGCAGGWFVRRMIEKGQFAVGIDGSDYSLKHRRAEWGSVPDNLFVADITKPFYFTDENETRFKFNIMSAFDVLEHLPEDHLPGFFGNLRDNLEPGGHFICSIADFPDEGYHVTLKPMEWWITLFNLNDFIADVLIEQYEYGRRSTFNLTFRYAPRG